MPLDNYGVLVGAFHHFESDPPVNYGRYYHGLIFVTAPAPTGGATTWRCAVDVKMPDGIVEYAKLGVKRQDVATALALPDGYHPLVSTATSGTVDYVRSPFISQPLGCLAIFYAILKLLTGKSNAVWRQNTGGSVLSDLSSTLTNVRRMYVFGARFHNTNSDEWGMHDVHMNQGDPPGSQWYASDAIWQDGAVMVEHNDDSVEFFLIKFLTQTLKTDDSGHPVV